MRSFCASKRPSAVWLGESRSRRSTHTFGMEIATLGRAQRSRRGRRNRRARRRHRSRPRRCRATPTSTRMVLVGLGREPERVGADAQVRVHRDEDGRRRRSSRARRSPSAGWPGPAPSGRAPSASCGPLRRDGDLEVAAGVEAHARGRATRASAEPSRSRAIVPGVAPALRALSLELVDLLDDVNRDDDVVVFELEDGVGIVKRTFVSRT